MGGELLGELLAKAAILDRVVHPTEHASGILHRFLVADMAAAGAKVGDMGALVIGGHLEAGAGACRILLEDQGDVSAQQPRLLGAGVFCGLEFGGQPEEEADFGRRIVVEREQAAAAKIDGHLQVLSVSEGVARQRAGHAMAAAATAAELGARDGDHFDARPAKQRVGVDVAVVADDDSGLDGDDVVAVVPLLALGLVAVAAGGDDPQAVETEGLLDDLQKRLRPQR